MNNVLEFIDQVNSLHLATRNAGGEPCASYAPFARSETPGLYIFVSELAMHCNNLLQYPMASCLIIEDETLASDIFARRRIQLECDAREIPRGVPAFESGMAALVRRHGDTAALLQELPDFHLIKLIPLKGTLVTGFATATTLDHESAPELISKALN